MTGAINHRAEAERLLGKSEDTIERTTAQRTQFATQAQVHATLALLDAVRTVAYEPMDPADFARIRREPGEERRARQDAESTGKPAGRTWSGTPTIDEGTKAGLPQEVLQRFIDEAVQEAADVGKPLSTAERTFLLLGFSAGWAKREEHEPPPAVPWRAVCDTCGTVTVHTTHLDDRSREQRFLAICTCGRSQVFSHAEARDRWAMKHEDRTRWNRVRHVVQREDRTEAEQR